MHHVVQPRHRHPTDLHGLLQWFPQESVARHLDIETGQHRLHRAVRAAPIGDHKSLEAEILLEHLGQGVLVFAGIGAVDPVVSAHHGARSGVSQSDLERQQVTLPHRSLIDH